jgi:hypothetical protein
VKRKRGKPHANALHQPVPELVKAEGLPERKRRCSYNHYSRYRRDNGYSIFPLTLEEKIALREVTAADRKRELRRRAKEEGSAHSETTGESNQNRQVLSRNAGTIHETQRRSQTAATVLGFHPFVAKPDEEGPELTTLRVELERHFACGKPLKIIYFGGSFPGGRRLLTPVRYCETRGRNYLIAFCHRSGIEKTFRLDRMHLP